MTLDVATIGRCGVDLYSNDIGQPLSEAKSFNAYVGGCPANVAVGTRRLGLRSALLTRVGTEPMGDFIMRFLEEERVDTRYVRRDPKHLSGLVILGIQPPDRFPLTFYREDCADIHLDLDDVGRVDWGEVRLVFFSGTGLSREPSLSATLLAVETARAAGAKTFLDLDHRPTLWDDPRSYGPVVRRALPLSDLVVGTEEEVAAAGGEEAILAAAPRAEALILKRGQRGSEVIAAGRRIEAEPFPVDILNVLGAGDAYVSGFIYGYLAGWDWRRCARLANATGAIVVTRHACANDMPTLEEALAFAEAGGGL